MKKVLLIGLILAICILAFPQGVMADSDSAEVNANIVEALEFRADPAEGTVFSLLAGPADTTLDNAVTFFVKSNGAWSVNVLSANPTNGKMVPNTAESGSQALDKELEIWSMAISDWEYVTVGNDILTGVNTGGTGISYPTDMQQETVFTDARLMGTGNYYTIDLTFTCVQDA